jgi:hypothetical protein
VPVPRTYLRVSTHGLPLTRRTSLAPTDIVAGDYTPQSSVDLFFTAAAKLGFHSGPLDISPMWHGRLIEGLVGADEEADEVSWREALGRRKRRTNGWWMRWDSDAIDLQS